MISFRNKGISTTLRILIILLVTVIIGGGVYLWQQINSISDLASNQPNGETAGWQTYINTEYGFEFKYPETFLKEIPSEASFNIGLLTFFFKKDGYYYPIWFYLGKINDKNILDMINPTSSIALDVNKGNKIIDNLDWNYVEEETVPIEGVGMAGSELLFYRLENDIIYALKCNNCNVEIFGETEQKSIFFQMLSTFKFLDQSVDWQTYINTEYGFSLGYFKNLGDPQVKSAPISCPFQNDSPTLLGCFNFSTDQKKYLPISVVNFVSDDKSEYNQMTISVFNNKNFLTLTDWYDDYSSKMFMTTEPTPINKRIAISIDGASGFIMEEGCCSNIDYNAYILAGDKVIVINLNGNVETNKAEKIKNYLSQILLTFKFLE